MERRRASAAELTAQLDRDEEEVTKSAVAVAQLHEMMHAIDFVIKWGD